MASKMKTLVLICLTGLFAFGSTASFALVNGCPDPTLLPGSNGCDLPGIKSGGGPYFDQAVDVKYKETKKGFKINAKFLSGSTRSSLVTTDDVYGIDNTKVNLKAKMKNGDFSGTLSIKGKMKDLGINKQRKLLEADLISIDHLGPLVGFDTANIVCDQMIIDAIGNCSTSESVYLSLIEDITAAIDDGATKIKTAGVMVTTVPVPAAAWLFASGLLGLVGMARRRAKV
jgi:hypothetical protein